MQPNAMDHLHERSIEALDATYADLLRLARQGTLGAKAQLREIVELRARLTGDVGRQAEQQQEITAIE
ncbi:MAG TPA: hypothetical protein VGP82_10900 [Ktedonobacterales bacterium]|jgi:hypothetical protein|nr:hypothetical protein [Ktedonobacterales bacterium]